jgi:hypothetical protein
MSLVILDKIPRPHTITLPIVLTTYLLVWGLAISISNEWPIRFSPQHDDPQFILRLASIATKAIPPLALISMIYALTAIPSELSHLPRAPIIPVFLSFIRGEPEDTRYRQQILPLLDHSDHGVVLVWMLGRWIVHVLDWRLGHVMAESTVLEKESPPDGMLLWELIGRRNFIFANGPLWRRYATIIKRGFEGPIPMDALVIQSRMLFSLIGNGGRLQANEWAQRYALATVGTT